MILHAYWRSTTSFRVRAALNLKQIEHTVVPVDLFQGEQHQPQFVALNPGRGVPALVLDDGTKLTQSMAILDYLDAVAAPRLTPKAPIARAKVLAAADIFASEVHPLNNLRVLAYLRDNLGCDEAQQRNWLHEWMRRGFDSYTALIDAARIAPDADFSFGATPTVADLCLMGQIISADRWGFDMSPYPRLQAIERACLALPAIERALPRNQPEAQPG